MAVLSQLCRDALPLRWQRAGPGLRGKAAARFSGYALRPIVMACAICTAIPAWAHAAQSPVAAGAANSGNTTFDLETMKAHGIDPEIAAYFSKTSRFTPGTHRISLTLNGEAKGVVSARFNVQGRLCFDRAFIDQAGLVLPAGLTGTATDAGADAQGACYDYRDAYPQTEATPDPAKNAVRLVVPAEAVRPQASATSHASGGTGAMLNYNVVTTGTQSPGERQQFTYADTELGFNMGDWIVRSRQSYTSDAGKGDFQHLYAYAQKTFVDQRSILQMGEINAAGTLFALPSLTGVQWFPDTALRPAGGNGTVSGLAHSQARVEVRQLGALVYSTVVPSGPFSLGNIPLMNATADVDVTVIETGGARQHFVIPAAQVLSGLSAPSGLSVAAGRARNTGDGADQPWVLSLTDGWAINRRLNLGGGVLASNAYQAGAASVEAQLATNWTGSLTTTVSNAQRDGARGVKLAANLYGALPRYQLSANLYANQQSAGYRDLPSVIGPDAYTASVRNQFGLSLTWQNALLGGFSLGYSQSGYFNGTALRRLTLAWNRQFGPATLSLNLERSLGHDAMDDGGTQLYAMLSLPLGSVSTRGYVNTSGGQTKLGAAVSQTVNDYVNYDLSADTTATAGGEPNVSGNLRVLPRYTQASIGYARSGANSSSFSAQLQGGAVATRDGVTLSPYQIGDTFGMLSADGESGIRISTPQGNVWTDPWGHAAIPNLPAFSTSRVEVATNSLPRNLDVKNGIRMLDPGRGSVSLLDFGMARVRRVLLNAKMPDGKPLPSRSMILDNKEGYVTTSVDDGVVFLDNAPASTLHAQLADGGTCRLDFALPKKQDTRQLYETASASCMPVRVAATSSTPSGASQDHVM